MENQGVNRREFLQSAAAVGATILASGPLLKVAGAPAANENKMRIFVCSVCGHIEFNAAPDNCPVCHSPKIKFKEDDNIFAEAKTKTPGGEEKHAPVVSMPKQSALLPELTTLELNVRVGKTIHPMEEAHHIGFIDCYSNDKHVARFSPALGVFPAAAFFVKNTAGPVRVVEWCNLHGYWQAESGAGVAG